MEDFGRNVKGWLLDKGVAESWVNFAELMLGIAAIFIIAFIADFIARRIILNVISRLVKRSKNTWDDILLEKRVFNTLSHIAPGLIVRMAIPYLFRDFEGWIKPMMTATEMYIILVLVKFIYSLLNALRQITVSIPALKDKPIASYSQLIKILVGALAGVLILSMLLGKSPIYLLTGLGAISAVLILIFKDTILGFVASIQLSVNDMLRVGDWVEMPKYGADGDVLEIKLTTVKVQNFDNTISTVPTYAFISDSVKNWRGMKDSGVRRIKRPVYIKISSIKFADEELIKRLSKIDLIKKYLTERSEEIEKYNQEKKADKSELINGRHMTNIGIFRKYAEQYLMNHPQIDPAFNLMVRQLSTEEKGVPVEIYCFAKTTVWEEYEGIQADIFDHLLAAVPTFGLEIFQSPTGSDFRALATDLRPPPTKPEEKEEEPKKETEKTKDTAKKAKKTGEEG